MLIELFDVFFKVCMAGGKQTVFSPPGSLTRSSRTEGLNIDPNMPVRLLIP